MIAHPTKQTIREGTLSLPSPLLGVIWIGREKNEIAARERKGRRKSEHGKTSYRSEKKIKV